MENRIDSPSVNAQERFFFGKKEDEPYDDYGNFDYGQDYDYGYHHHFLDRFADEEYEDYDEKNEGFSIKQFVENLLNWSQ